MRDPGQRIEELDAGGRVQRADLAAHDEDPPIVEDPPIIEWPPIDDGPDLEKTKTGPARTRGPERRSSGWIPRFRPWLSLAHLDRWQPVAVASTA